VAGSGASVSPTHGTVQPEFINDPVEPLNRGLWEVNRGLLVGVVEPTGKVYRTVVPNRVRTSIKDFTRNITYPGRVINHGLQGRWSGAGDETLRFLCNTTVGVGGIFDVATKWNMPKSDADFSQTFGTWGWQPQTFLVLPFLGPSDDRHALGWVADSAAEPWSYAYPYRYASHASTYNRVTDRSEEAVRLLRSEPDSYTLVKYAWTYTTKDGEPDWTLKGPVDVATMQTLGAAKVGVEDPGFLGRGNVIRVRIPSTGRNLRFNCWLQQGPSPLAYIAPGLSSHRLSMSTLSVAENLYRNGFSVVTTTSVFHPDFMENASSAALPGNTAVDSRDMHVAITEVDRKLAARHPGRFGKRALVGLSMGGFLALRLAAHEDQADPGLLAFDRYVAIDTPIELREGARTVDSFKDAPKAWPAEERQARLNNTLHKAAAIATSGTMPEGQPPFDAIESKYLIGLTFRITLRDIIFSSQKRNDMGVLQTPLSSWRREAVYREIMEYSYKDYFLKFLAPYYKERGVDFNGLVREGSLRTHEAGLRKQSKTRVLVNQNDFLLKPGDLSWLRSTFNQSRLTVFSDGGHLGNLGDPPVQSALIKALDGLGNQQP
jgi:ABC-type transporter lipoprotein component MlaA/pimeloyl-ACP methyl ester carboxylesterase